MCVYESWMLGCPAVIVEIDESMFGKRKYNRGKRVNGTWVFGDIEKSTNKCFFHVVQDRSKDTLLASIKTTRGLLATDHVILNHGQVTWKTPELAPPLLTTTPHQREDVSALDRFNVHLYPTRRVFSGTGLEPVTKQATVRYLYHSATAATLIAGKLMIVWKIRSCHFWEKGKKADLTKLAIELGEWESNGEELKIIELRTKILTNDAYKEDPEFVKCVFEGIVSNSIDEENKQKDDVTSLIAREPEEKCRDYSHIRGMLLQRFKLTAEKFRELFSRYRKNPNRTWKDYYFEIRRYFEECKEHYLDIWAELLSPETLADKLGAFDNIRRSLPGGPRRYVKASEIVNDGKQVSFRKPERPPKREYSHQVPNERSPLRCYGCGKQGVIKSRCPTCSLNASQRTYLTINHINAYTAQTRSPQLTLIDITFCGIKGRVCADTGSSHTIAGKRMFQIFKDKGFLFQETTLTMSLADGQQTTGEFLTTQVMVEIEGRSVLTKFIILPKAKRNRTLLGTDFFSSAGLVLDVKNTCWYFWDNPTHKYPFGEELDTPSIVEKMSRNTCQLREGEGESLTSVCVCVCAQKEKLNLLLESFQNVFEPGGEATHILEHHINTGNSLPISVSTYRMSPVKKEILRKEIEDLLEKDIIEKCESPYGAPVVLIPKPNNQFRLCIDYRKLNEVTVSDTYPLPRMDDLLQEAKHTAYISTIDLKSGYHQVNVNPADRDKTAFVCPFGTYRFKRGCPSDLRMHPQPFRD
ncbi:hypothetical protein TNCV_2695091 [Trichonephila clavipes]|nr:hypothetical protein TNCV_2695091 [Trichonephila clavipes]